MIYAGFDKFCPLGPCLVSREALLDPHIVQLKTHLNGELMQNGTAKKMIFPLAKSVSLACSRARSLLPLLTPMIPCPT